ncbi:uncharacterized protein LOC116770408 [Danaus plexippus]|uniref:uncharacterized protein LOC116770408 n=1 Tax=Danaus plexippus TaxID=13037 RepID=UPI002AB11326|nr:uncharacterized protein LOC116770408 [Danaus plexippus]XP_061383601.1 uncharacterized protein LOC116770408 [Danaus plexippus]
MEWSKKETFQFLKLFQKEPMIWDPKNKFHKNNHKVNDAWARLSEEMCRPVPELKNKKNSLMATFRQHLRRKKQSLKSGAGEDDVYKPVWLYYDAMETFLASVYKCHTSINTEEGLHEELISPGLPNVDDETHNDNEQNNELINDQHDEQISEKHKPVNNKKSFKSPIKRKRTHEDSETDIHKNIKDTVSNLNNMLLNRKENDECDLYAQLLATRLREYSKQERRQIMHDIDGLLLANPHSHTHFLYNDCDGCTRNCE